ncbi:MAG TPA: FAD-dependent oxidoreductase [Candidatus Brocadiia bacterium]|nr:FAD-dependent oxidoreductase [Candidatus Brocadiia bacterium]
MNTIHEPARDLPLVEDCDVCVLGGSCTGVFAAVAASRMGARACVVEACGFFGGMATAGLVSIWHSTLDTNFERQIIAGLTTEVIERLQKRGGVTVFTRNPDRHCVLNTEELKIELDELTREAGVRPFLHTRFCAPIIDSGRLDAVAIEDKTGRRAIRAKVFIDATGDGDLVARMGLPCETRPRLQPPTTCMILRGIQTLARKRPDFSWPAMLRAADLPPSAQRGFLWTAHVPGASDDTLVAGTRMVDVDCSDADALTAAEIEGRRQTRALCDAIRAFEPNLPESLLANLPAHVGVRETRHARCVHRVTEQEVLTGFRFPDAIANGTYRVDIHHSEKPGLTFRYLDGREVYVVPGEKLQEGRWRPQTAENPAFYQVPYRALVPQGARNVLVAGRLMDADRGAYGALRVMVNCNQTGQAAGCAAALAAQRGISVADVPAAALRDVLRSQNAVII